MRPGELRGCDVRAALRCAPRKRGQAPPTTIDILVLGPPGCPPWSGTVALVPKPSGRGAHVCPACPICERAREVLRVRRLYGRPVLGCGDCLKFRTRRQVERTTASWRRSGGEKEDRFLRLLRRPDKTPELLEQARRLLLELLREDRARFGALAPEVDAMIEVLEPTGAAHSPRFPFMPNQQLVGPPRRRRRPRAGD